MSERDTTVLPEISDDMNMVPLEQKSPEESSGSVGKEQPPGEVNIPGGDWEK